MYGSDCGVEIESPLLSGRSGLSNPPRMNAPENYLGVVRPDEIERPHKSLADEVCYSLIVLAKAEKPRRLRRIQKSGARAIGRYSEGLLPKKIPQVRGLAGMWRPARVVGGDYFDVRKFSESKIGVGIGDVVGKGLSAALLMANLQASFRAFASEVLYPFRSTVLTSFAAFAVQKLLMSSRHRLPFNHALRNRRKAKS